MKINLQSISAKLILGGIAVVLVSLSVVGYISFSKAESALRGLSMHQAQGIASDLARMTRNTLTTEKNIAATLAAEKNIVDLVAAVDASGIDSVKTQSEAVFKALKRQFRKMGNQYQGVYMTDSRGQLFNGVLEDGRTDDGSGLHDGAPLELEVLDAFFNGIRDGLQG